MYRHLPPDFWRAELGVDEASAPRALVVHGEWDSARVLTLARACVEGARLVTSFLVVGRRDGVPVAIANVYGPTMAADVTFVVVRAGARVAIQTGFFGGLQTELSADAVLVPDAIAPEDGVARRFARRGPIEQTESAGLREALAGHGGLTGGVLVSTGSIAAETDRVVARWARAGHAGVDLESAATVATARSLGARAGVALHVIDNLARGESFQHERVSTAAARARRDERVDRLLRAALDYAVVTAGQSCPA